MTNTAFIPWLSSRLLNGLGLLACAGLLGFGYYLQYVQGLQPCPLCMTQRIMFYGAGLFFLLAALHNPGVTGQRVYSLLSGLFCLGGLGFASRQLWLQNLPADEVPPCGPDLDFMFEAFPLTDVLQAMTMGSGNCAEVSWVFLGLSIPGWAAVAFSGLLILSIINLVTARSS